jgi:competence protein ComEC
MIRIHFLNIGHGDCIIVEFLDAGRVAVIDINMTDDMDETTKDELLSEAFRSFPILHQSFYKQQYSTGTMSREQILIRAGYDIKLQNPINYMTDNNIGRIFRFISTHPHMDHLSGLKELKDTKGIDVLWISKNNHTQDETELTSSQKEDWNFYKKYRDTNEHYLDGICTVRPQAGDSDQFWYNDNITILAPNSDLLKNSNPNNLSYVILIKYGGKKIILGGDAEKDSWDYIMDNYSDLIKDVSILKASHHGRDSGYHQNAVKHMNPKYTIVSVGKKPSNDASNKYRQYCDNVWSTRWKGNIVFEIQSDGSWSYKTEYNR